MVFLLSRMTQSQHAAAPSLELIFETIHGFQRTGAIKAAVELDLFTRIAEGADTVAKLAERTHASAKGIRILCDYLVVIGLLTKSDDLYGLTLDSGFFLNRQSPGYMGTAVEFLLAPPQVDPFHDVASAVRKGGAVGGQGVIAPDHPVWVKFAHAMGPLMAFPAELRAQLPTSGGDPISKVLDIAAGHGLYGIAVTKRRADAELFAVDWPNVGSSGRKRHGIRYGRSLPSRWRQCLRRAIRRRIRSGARDQLPASF